jgi:3-phenylpropionate/trans-cinnamate dioxygenase ferredoxin subunit
MAYVKVAKVSEIPQDKGKLVEAGGRKLAVFNVDGKFYAIDDTCTHRGGPLSEGQLERYDVTCPWHGSVFDVRTGNVLQPPATRSVAHYEVRVAGNDIEIEIPAESSAAG